MTDFKDEIPGRIAAIAADRPLNEAAMTFLQASTGPQYSYNFSWLGRPIIQYPQDVVAMQELIWQIRPDLIIETGIAHGGSLILSASMLALMDMAITACKKQNKYVGICGQGPSDHPDLARWLLDRGISSVSLNPDTVVDTWLFLAGKQAGD